MISSASERVSLETTPFRCPSSPRALADLKGRTRTFLGELLGKPPFEQKPPLNAQIVSSADMGGFWRGKVRYGNESDDIVWAWLLVPKGITETVPAVICLPGTFMTLNWGKDGPAGLAEPENPGDPEAYGADLAKLGYVTLCPDHPAAGERTPPGLKSHDTAELERRFPTWTRVGMSAWDVGRAVDFLGTVQEVDTGRIGCTGWSQGGQMTLLGAALEPRISVIVSVCGWSPFRGLDSAHLENLFASYNYPRLREYAEERRRLPFDLDHVAACLVPRPFLNFNAADDEFFPNKAEMHAAEREIHKMYRMRGVGERFKAIWAGGRHAYGAAAARETQTWFHRWLWEKRST